MEEGMLVVLPTSRFAYTEVDSQRDPSCFALNIHVGAIRQHEHAPA